MKWKVWVSKFLEVSGRSLEQMNLILYFKAVAG